ncbi:MAG: hypothetical protein HYV35_00995, partial [Lentisphaerae bacterium]|nr:hypothetical protein [Lentisphaerota bacterium]
MNPSRRHLLASAIVALASWSALGVIPSIQANGGGGTVTVVESNSLSLTIQLNAEGATGTADWWLLANAGSAWYFFDAASGHWQPGFQVTHQGALVDLSSTEVLRLSGLAPGVYYIYFGVDLTPDGVVNDPLDYDLITVNAVTHDSLSDLYVDVYDEAKAYNGLTYFSEAHSVPRIVAVDMSGAITWEYIVPSNLREYTDPGFDVEVLTNGHILFVLPSNGVYV